MSGNFGLGWLFSSKKKTPRSNFRRRDFRHLRVEMLESKLPLAGNVAAFVAGDILVLTGDAASNAYRISGANGFVRVIGQGTTSVTWSSPGLKVSALGPPAEAHQPARPDSVARWSAPRSHPAREPRPRRPEAA